MTGKVEAHQYEDAKTEKKEADRDGLKGGEAAEAEEHGENGEAREAAGQR